MGRRHALPYSNILMVISGERRLQACTVRQRAGRNARCSIQRDFQKLLAAGCRETIGWQPALPRNSSRRLLIALTSICRRDRENECHADDCKIDMNILAEIGHALWMVFAFSKHFTGKKIIIPSQPLRREL